MGTGILSFLKKIGSLATHFSRRGTLTSSIHSQTGDDGPGADDKIHSVSNLFNTGENGQAGISESEKTLVPDQEDQIALYKSK
jgi:hypothetical protein